MRIQLLHKPTVIRKQELRPKLAFMHTGNVFTFCIFQLHQRRRNLSGLLLQRLRRRPLVSLQHRDQLFPNVPRGDPIETGTPVVLQRVRQGRGDS